jgi:hypothetical protein
MSPVPDVASEAIILSSASTTTIPNVISSSDELDQTMFNEKVMGLGLVFFLFLLDSIFYSQFINC